MVPVDLCAAIKVQNNFFEEHLNAQDILKDPDLYWQFLITKVHKSPNLLVKVQRPADDS